MVWSLGREDHPGGGHGNPLLDSCLGNPMDRGSWWAAVHGVAKSWTQLRKHTKKKDSTDGQVGEGLSKHREKAQICVSSGYWNVYLLCLFLNLQYRRMHTCALSPRQWQGLGCEALGGGVWWGAWWEVTTRDLPYLRCTCSHWGFERHSSRSRMHLPPTASPQLDKDTHSVTVYHPLFHSSCHCSCQLRQATEGPLSSRPHLHLGHSFLK